MIKIAIRRKIKEKSITNKCNHTIGKSTDTMYITRIKPHVHKGLHLHINYEVRCKYCNKLFESGSVPTFKSFLNTSYFTGEIKF